MRALLLLALVVAAGCSKKGSGNPAPEVTGLATVPASAEAIVGADVPKLIASPVLERAAEQLLLRDASLAENWSIVQDACKIDPNKQLKRLMFAIGPHNKPQPGTGPVILVAVGAIPETSLEECVGKIVGKGKGSVTGKSSDGRTLYFAKDGNRTMYFAYGRPDTVVLGSNEPFVVEALGTGKKAPDNPALAKWLALVDQNAPLWAVGTVDPMLRDGLVKFTEGKVAHGPVAYYATASFTDGIALELAAVMPSPEDAKQLESYANGELPLWIAAAQLKSLGTFVNKFKIVVENEVVHFRLALTTEDLNVLLSALDDGGKAAQDVPPSGPPVK
jgi:hypothetical protein